MAVSAKNSDPINPVMAATSPSGVDDERLAAIKLQVLNGTYLTQARLDAACEALFNSLTRTPSQRTNPNKQLCGC